jgi:hypothetical protein
MLQAAYPWIYEYTQPEDIYLEDSEHKVVCPCLDRGRFVNIIF